MTRCRDLQDCRLPSTKHYFIITKFHGNKVGHLSVFSQQILLNYIMLTRCLDLQYCRLPSTKHFFIITKVHREQSHALVCFQPVDPIELHNVDWMS